MENNNHELANVVYSDLKANPYNPRELFDRKEIDILKDSIKNVGVLVPLLVYKRNKDAKLIIMDGERRWRCVRELIEEYPSEKNKWEKIPVNIIPEPDMVNNILRMFNIHNVRQPWELMPTALKLDVIMNKLKERNDDKIAKLTGLSPTNVRRCKILLTFSNSYQEMMMHPDPEKRIKADFFIELYPLLSLISKNLPNISRKYDGDKITQIFLDKYIAKTFSNVIGFRDLTDTIRQLKNGLIGLHECEKFFISILESDVEINSLVKQNSSSLKKAEKFQKTVEAMNNEIKIFDPLTVRERDKIQDLLEGLMKSIQAKLVELEHFEDKD
jgi:ParB/RepB/Spo0J family partition protein